MMRSGWLGLLFGWVLMAPVVAVPAEPPVVAIEHARIFPGDGSLLEDGTLLLGPGSGKILAVGPAASVAVPTAATRIAGQGSFVTAGLFDAESRVGLHEVSLEPVTLESGLDGRYGAVRAAFSVAAGFNPASVVLPILRLQGITSAALAPSLGLVAGRGAVVDLAGSGFAEADFLVRPDTALYIQYSDAGKASAFGARGGLVLRLRELFDDVRQYAKRRPDFEKNQMRQVAASRLDLEALLPFVAPPSGQPLPVVVEVHRAADILAVVRLAQAEKLRLILSGVEEGWRVAPQLAAAGVPVIVKPLTNLPASFETLGSRFDNPARLAAAGVRIAISPRLMEPHNSRSLRIEAGNAVANGLPYAVALQAITKIPAELFGVADSHGTLTVGRVANVVVWSGDPLETATRVQRLYLRGQELPLVSRQTLLRDRYRSLTLARPQP
jgi:imidazolonepropionase-like amidohydrolase